MTYMIDTNIVSGIVRFPRGVAARRVAGIGREGLLLSIFVVAELQTWIVKGASAAVTDQFHRLVAYLGVAPFEQPGEIIYADIRADLERSGKTIGANDLWIAAHALALDCTLVTANEREFRRVPGLKVENWLA